MTHTMMRWLWILGLLALGCGGGESSSEGPTGGSVASLGGSGASSGSQAGGAGSPASGGAANGPTGTADTGGGLAVGASGSSTGGGPPASLVLEPRNQHIASGDVRTCVITEETEVECWGASSTAQPLTPGYAAVSAGEANTCVLDQAGVATCWGDVWIRDLTLSETFSSLAVNSYVCGLHLADGTSSCWDSQGGTGPVPGISTAGGFGQITLGTNHVCAIQSADLRLQCWAAAGYEYRAAAPDGQFVQVSAYSSYACALRPNGELVCWGDDNLQGRATPPPGTYQNVSLGFGAACAILTDGNAVCWGDPYLSDATIPPGPYVEIAAAQTYACAIRTGGEVVCWSAAPTYPHPPEGLRALQ